MSFSILLSEDVVMDKKKVKDYMTYDVVSIDLHSTAKDVIEKIQKTNHDGFPVVDGEAVVGILPHAISCLLIQGRQSSR